MASRPSRARTYSLAEIRDGTGWVRGVRFAAHGHTYTLAEVRHGTGWPRGIRFKMMPPQRGSRFGNSERYKIVRFHMRGRPRTVQRGLTLEQAQAHCHDPETSSSTCKSSARRRYTKTHGPWFEGYSEDK